jgi:2-haloacid dehalogenase
MGARQLPLRGQTTKATTAGVKALIFDTFGTVVDWRGSIIEEGMLGARPKAS